MSEPNPGALAYDGLDAGAREALSERCGPSSRARSSPSPARSTPPTSTPRRSSSGLRELGVFGFTIPQEYGGRGHGLHAYCLAVEEIARGWMSVAGILNTHFIVSSMLLRFGTEEQRRASSPASRPASCAPRSR